VNNLSNVMRVCNHC